MLCDHVIGRAATLSEKQDVTDASRPACLNQLSKPCLRAEKLPSHNPKSFVEAIVLYASIFSKFSVPSRVRNGLTIAKQSEQ